MSSKIVQDIGEIHSRIFDHRPFLNGEINFFFRQFEEERRDREIENLFLAQQNTIEVKDSSVERCCLASETHLPQLKDTLNKTLEACDKFLNRETDPIHQEKLQKNRLDRKKIWQYFVDDMTHKCSRVDVTFEEKEEELREFYSDLERKLHIHK